MIGKHAKIPKDGNLTGKLEENGVGPFFQAPFKGDQVSDNMTVLGWAIIGFITGNVHSTYRHTGRLRITV